LLAGWLADLVCFMLDRIVECKLFFYSQG